MIWENNVVPMFYLKGCPKGVQKDAWTLECTEMKPRVFQGGPREEIVVPKGDPDTKGDPLDCQGVQGLLGAPLISVRILTHLTSSQFLNIQYTITKYCWCHIVDRWRGTSHLTLSRLGSFAFFALPRTFVAHSTRTNLFERYLVISTFSKWTVFFITYLCPRPYSILWRALVSPWGSSPAGLLSSYAR